MTLYVYRLEGHFVAAFDDLDRAELWAFSNLLLLEGGVTLERVDTVADQVTIPRWKKP